MPLGVDWVDAAKVFSDIGFVGVTAWLLCERFYWQRQREKVDKRRDEREREMANAIRDSAVALQRVGDTQLSVMEALKDVRAEIRLASLRGGG